MITIGNKQICEYCLNEGSGKTCRFCGFDKAKYENEWGTLSPGSVLSGKYIVGKIIGKGGFGITYLAYDIKHEKKVALKEYYPVTYAIRSKDGVTVAASRAEDADTYKNGMEKFYEEASLVSRFNGNPNIVSVYEFFYENGTAYFVMELLRGISLKAYLDEHGALSPEETLYIADKVSSALVVTHSMNTLHRDISPDNIMLCEDGNVKLIDFGAARQVAADNPKSMSVILKQGFAPLEQYQRRGRQGPWTDLYSLGATLYYAATKQLLDDPMSRLDDDGEFQSNSHGIEPQMWEVIRHSLNIKVEERYKDTVEFRAALNKVEYEPKPLIITLPDEQITAAAAAAPIMPITAAAANGVTMSGAPAQVVMPGEKKPLNKKLIAILGSAIGVVLVAGITVIAVTLGGKKNSLGVKPGGNDSYQQTSGANSELEEQNNSDAAASSTTTTSTVSSTSTSSTTSSTAAVTSTETSTSTPVSTPDASSSEETAPPVSSTSTSSSKKPSGATSGGTTPSGGTSGATDKNPTPSSSTSSSAAPTPKPDPAPTYSPGKWSGSTFTSDFLGLKVQLDGWSKYSDADLASFNGTSDMSYNGVKSVLDSGTGMLYMSADYSGGVSMNMYIDRAKNITGNKGLSVACMKEIYEDAGYSCDAVEVEVDFMGKKVKGIEATISRGSSKWYDLRVNVPGFTKSSGHYYAEVSVFSPDKNDTYRFLSWVKKK